MKTPIQKLHDAFATTPYAARAQAGYEWSEHDDDATLKRLARQHGVELREATMEAASSSWGLEREARLARKWAARVHPGAPLDLEGFAAYIAGGMYGHLERREGLAWGRTIWFKALAPIAQWEAQRIIVASRKATRRMYARRAAKLARYARGELGARELP
jgi:hypothetical protein